MLETVERDGAVVPASEIVASGGLRKGDRLQLARPGYVVPLEIVAAGPKQLAIKAHPIAPGTITANPRWKARPLLHLHADGFRSGLDRSAPAFFASNVLAHRDWTPEDFLAGDSWSHWDRIRRAVLDDLRTVRWDSPEGWYLLAGVGKEVAQARKLPPIKRTPPAPLRGPRPVGGPRWRYTWAHGYYDPQPGEHLTDLSEFRPGDSLHLPGSLLHDDLAGLVCVLEAATVQTIGTKIRIFDRSTKSSADFERTTQVYAVPYG